MRITLNYRADAHLSRAMAVLVAVLLTTPAQAVLDLSVNPTDGGNSIRFGKVSLPTTVGAEVRIRITSSDNEQYQVFQRIEQPFTNERGEQLERQIIQTSALIGSNGSGTLYIEDAQRMNFSEQLIYTSNPDGLSDAFTLVYHVDPDEVTKGGNFFGRILYSIRPVGGMGRSEEVVLNAYLDGDEEDLAIEVRSDSGTGRVQLSTSSERDREAGIEVKFKGNSGRVRIYQQIDQFPISEDGRSLERETIEFQVAGAEGGETDFLQPASFDQRRVLIYEGEAMDDAFMINYAINDRQEQFAGHYKGTMSLIVEGDQINDVHPFEISVDVAPVFELTAEFPEDGVSFTGLIPDSAPQLKEVVVSVHTNLGKAYEVIQSMSGLMTNESGDMIDPEYFTMSQELLADEKGEVQVDEFTPVESGDQTIFKSDRSGSPAKFKVIYRLRPYPKMPAGDYKTAVVYSLNEV